MTVLYDMRSVAAAQRGSALAPEDTALAGMGQRSAGWRGSVADRYSGSVLLHRFA